MMSKTALPAEFLKKPNGGESRYAAASNGSTSAVIADDDKDLGEPSSPPAASDNVAAHKNRSAVLDVTTSFKELGVCEDLIQACTRMGWHHPTRIQKESLPHALQGRDVIGLAQTGSGKTAAFALPILQALLNAFNEKQNITGYALVIAPTRELAFQIGKQFEALGAEIKVQVAVLVGGVDNMTQSIALAKRPHVIVGTPGRIVHHLENTKGFSLRALRYLVLDEADRLLNLDFEQELNTILKVIPRERHTYLYSATMTSKVQKLQRASLNDPVKVEVSTKYATVDTLLQQYTFIPAKYKDCYLVYMLNELAGNSVIIFVATCLNCQKLTLMLRNLGFAAVPLHGNMAQPKRLAALHKFQAGERKILVATDVASRGLDIPLVDVVVNYDTPTHSKDYIHRVGRTARAGQSGRAISVVTQYDVELFQRIEELIGAKMELFKTEEAQVLTLLERVSEAQRLAAMDLREAGVIRKEKKSADDALPGDADNGDEGEQTRVRHKHKPMHSKGASAKRGRKR